MNLKTISIVRKEELRNIRLANLIAPKHDFYKLIKNYNFYVYFSNYVSLQVDAIEFYAGIWQFVDFRLCNKENFNWGENGIPLDIVNNLTRGNHRATQIGDLMRFDKKHNFENLKIIEYSQKKVVDLAQNKIFPQQVGVDFNKYGTIWFNYEPLSICSAIKKERIL